MAEHNNDSDKITFKVKHLDQYHDIVIDLNDDRNEYKHQQLFEQLESITGVPSRYTTSFIIPRNMNPSDVNNIERYLMCFYNQKAFAHDLRMEYTEYMDDDIFSVNIRDGERFHLKYYASYRYSISKRINMCYRLAEERDVPEEGCGRNVCQFLRTESFFKRLKDLVNNDELNAKITQLVQPLFEISSPETHLEAWKILKEFNVFQVLYPSCVWHHRWRLAETGDARQNDLYLRTRG
ncbi:uncharacterized protein LOC107365657 isoform X1 [Tetranychus urticae]|uniref:uncharacterized protein LOC107365657 isoform X1 n=1 Tax=Tetranychus urticae TaxID=32264 RepID=UPI000D657B91|nr:uncharacterized protein LOC107365657 isoform X1 [Tetranychus urticae]